MTEASLAGLSQGEGDDPAGGIGEAHRLLCLRLELERFSGPVRQYRPVSRDYAAELLDIRAGWRLRTLHDALNDAPDASEGAA